MEELPRLRQFTGQQATALTGCGDRLPCLSVRRFPRRLVKGQAHDRIFASRLVGQPD
jgi:hypothetical protein